MGVYMECRAISPRIKEYPCTKPPTASPLGLSVLIHTADGRRNRRRAALHLQRRKHA
jgi:hypothetical protein